MSEHGEARIQPLPETEWNADLAGIRAGLRPVLNVHRVLANHPQLLEAWAPLRTHVSTGGSLSARNREMVILRVAHRAGSAYEWHHHVLRGREAGLADDEIEVIRDPSPAGATITETALLVATDELVDGLSIRDPTWDVLRTAFSDQEILDLIITVGVYLTLAMVIASARVPIEP
jgi:alkylhydroperoxidase family enzyme